MNVPLPAAKLLLTLMRVEGIADCLLHSLQGVIEEVREDNVIRSVREDSESSCVGEIAFFMAIAQPRTFQVRPRSAHALTMQARLSPELTKSAALESEHTGFRTS